LQATFLVRCGYYYNLDIIFTAFPRGFDGAG